MAGDWRAGLTVVLDGQDLSARVVGRFEWHAERTAARTATLALQPEAGTYAPADWSGKAITIDATMDGATKRRFTGWTRYPSYDPVTGVLQLELTDRLQQRYRDMDQAAIEAELAGARWHEAIHGEPGDGWDIAERLLDTVPYGVSLAHDGALRYLPWAAGTVDFARDFSLGHGYADEPVMLEPADEDRRINLCTMELQARDAMRHHWEMAMNWSAYPPGETFCNDYRVWPWWLPWQDTVAQAAEGGGVAIQQPVTLLSVAGLSTGIAFTGLPESDGNPCGNQVPWVISPDDPRVVSASWTATRRWVQRLLATYDLTVRAPDSQDEFGDGIDEDRASLDTDVDAGAWDNETGTETPSGGNWAGTAPHLYSPDLDQADVDAAIACFVAVKASAILDSHLWRVTWADLPAEVADIDLGHTVSLAGRGVTCIARVEAIDEYWDLDSGDAQTSITVAVSVCPGAGGSDTPIAAPDAPDFAPGYTLPVPPSLGTYVGGRTGSIAWSDAWRGWITNQEALEPGEEFYEPINGRFVVEYPDVPDESRSDDAAATTVAEYLVYPPNELLQVVIP